MILSTIDQQRLTEARICGSRIYSPYQTKPIYLSNKLDKQRYTGRLLSGQPGQLIARNRGAFESNRLEDYLPAVSFLPAYSRERGAGNSTQSAYLLRASGDILMAAITEPTVENNHAAALVYLLNGELDNAIAKLEAASTQAPQNSRLTSDLATIYLERARAQQRPQDIFHALSLIEATIALDPNLLEARFNRALILEELFLRAQARQQWQEYLQRDSSSAWAQEARAHIEKLTQPSEVMLWQQARVQLEQDVLADRDSEAHKIITRYPHYARMYALNELLPQWAELRAKNSNEQAANVLKIARMIGDVLVEYQRDKMIRDMVAALDKVILSADKSLIDAAIAAHQQYQQGRILVEQEDADKAMSPLLNAKKLFIQINDRPGESLANLFLGRALSGVSKYEASLATFSTLSETEKADYPYVAGQTLSFMGRIHINRFDLSVSLSELLTAIHYFSMIEDHGKLVAIHLSIAEILNQIGDSDEIWHHYYQALKYLSHDFTPTGPLSSNSIQRVISLAYLLSLTSEKLGSLYFYNEAISAGTTNKSKLALFTAYHWRGVVNYQLNRLAAAQADLAKAKEYATKFDDASLRERVNEQLLIAEGEYQLSTNPGATIAALTKVIEGYQHTSDRSQFTQVYLSRARAYLAIGDYDRVEADLQISINEFERQRSNIKKESYRASFFETPQSAYDEMIGFQLDHHNAITRAFEYAETSHARALLDIINGGQRKIDQAFNVLLDKSAHPLSLAQIQSQIPSDYVLLQYYLLPDRLLIWLVEADHIQLITRPIDLPALTQQLQAFNSAIEKPRSLSAVELSSAQSLYQLLIGSLDLPPEKKLVIVPDKELLTLPFAALLDPISGQYLIEQHALAVAPSASVFVHCLQRDQQLARKYRQQDESLLAIGNPKIDRNAFPDLLPLPAATDEASAIAKLYRHSRLLVEEQATKKAFLAAQDHYTIIHFAGHAIMDSNTPLYSKLIFAGESEQDDDNGALYAYELYQRSLRNTRLVVLAACKTANGRQVKGEGIANLARPFLAAGVPTVIGSLWNANDQASAQLFTRFHAARIAGEDTVTALRSAQLSLIHHQDAELRSPAMWASFVALGGTTRRE